MYSKFQLDSEWRVSTAWTVQLVSQWEISDPISGTVGAGLPN